VECLKGVAEGRPVDLGQDIGANLNSVIWPDSDEVVIEGGMVDLAHRYPVGHERVAALSIMQNVAASKSSTWRSRRSSIDSRKRGGPEPGRVAGGVAVGPSEPHIDAGRQGQ
jgi:hypothetical protein